MAGSYPHPESASRESASRESVSIPDPGTNWIIQTSPTFLIRNGSSNLIKTVLREFVDFLIRNGWGKVTKTVIQNS